MSDQEFRKQQPADPQKPVEQKPVSQAHEPAPAKLEIPVAQPKTPQPVQERHADEKKKPV
jgi:hypothetical protein